MNVPHPFFYVGNQLCVYNAGGHGGWRKASAHELAEYVETREREQKATLQKVSVK